MGFFRGCGTYHRRRRQSSLQFEYFMKTFAFGFFQFVACHEHLIFHRRIGIVFFVIPTLGKIHNLLEKRQRRFATTNDRSTYVIKLVLSLSAAFKYGSRTFSLYDWVHVPIGNSVISIFSSLTIPTSPLVMKRVSPNFSISPKKFLYHGFWLKTRKKKIRKSCQHARLLQPERTHHRYGFVAAYHSL